MGRTSFVVWVSLSAMSMIGLPRAAVRARHPSSVMMCRDELS
jgi:hypothetical protein